MPEPSSDEWSQMGARRRALIAVSAALLLAGCFTTDISHGPADRAALVSIDDLGPWLRSKSIELHPLQDELTKRRIAWSYELSYAFDGVTADGGTRMVLRSELAVHPNQEAARQAFETYRLGLARGLRKGGAEIRRLRSNLVWGRRTQLFAIHMDGRRLGHGFIGYNQRVATYVLVTGLHPELAEFEAILAAKLRELDRYAAKVPVGAGVSAAGKPASTAESPRS